MSVITAHKWMWSTHPAGSPATAIAGTSRRSRTGLMLERHERILAETRSADGGRVLGTDRALIVVGAQGCIRRLNWTEIADVAWSPATTSAVVSLWPVADERPSRLTVPTDRRFAALAVDRVAAAQVLRRRVQLTATVAATVLATRTPSQDGVTWRVVLDVADEHDPVITQAANRAVAELRALAGC